MKNEITGVKINVTLKIPPGDTCYYPPKPGYANGCCCDWRLGREESFRDRWCKLFDLVNVKNGGKCPECLKATAKGEKILEADNG